ncbi:Trigger factor [Quillaja saponaria]|uniref:peptidylprolyl isomerase n=1 Tax=Quillaja saponaria TaxID=32244 RepID=A0AAD7VM99_QUISA|nr:Trigger factor [Quillaja saponaria]
MHVATQTLILGLYPKIVSCKQSFDGFIIPSLNCKMPCVLHQRRHDKEQYFKRKYLTCLPVRSTALSDVGISPTHSKDLSVSTSTTSDVRELKMNIEVSGTKTQLIFDDVFDKMVAAAQPIPGFRRVKGGKTPDVSFCLFQFWCNQLINLIIPKDILLEVLGPSKVLKEVIKKIINITVAEYVEKEALKVSKDLKVEQSFEDLESTFEAGQKFSFDAVIHLQEAN